MIGIDIADTARFVKLKKEDFPYWEKYFTQGEWGYSFGKANPEEHLSGIFAAKEAVMKALGGEFVGRFDKIQIIHSEGGQPIALIQNEKRNVEVSISHDHGVSVAVAINLDSIKGT
ncbi:MAG TPA: 4'-phosphopantetheinyl transferase superfamily protein [Patescibacteria group bacterium]|nr:4'-phosphopantetheinyl transferase superfamily protein [Patescibacteria group bacterium]